jgi:hypothetical protein
MAAPAEGQEGTRRAERSAPAARGEQLARAGVLEPAHVVQLVLGLTRRATAVAR